ncbi:family 20 glycosylhydrolase [Fulvivirgaceae bacterium BMA10]|uniref:beta-N-acetylhexosaminidase n=1 Tax=Splendidivirga corallicola TaxID=3051826 RepID=A0ABT8KNC5_9BACT|nr:family 20 glycosylhydrolase [Fulvivirgaceae bacterium BMA10]
MKKIVLSIVLIFLVMACEPPKPIQVEDIAIIPQPSNISTGQGYFEIESSTMISVENETQRKVVDLFLSELEKVAGWRPEVKNESASADISLKEDSSMDREAYELTVTMDAINIKAGSPAGFFYAFQSLKQLLPTAFSAGSLQKGVEWTVPSITINDSPVFGWRGYMLDVSRHFFDKEDVKKVLDFMAELKLNRFHWHLADDQGWRVEIKSYPKLTEIGAWRVDYNVTDETISNWWGRPVQKEGDEATYGGFYTQEEVKEIIAYAKERFIEVIPEIDMPGHAQATIAAYPEIGCVNAEPYVATGGVYKNNTYNPGKEETFVFAEKMLNEVMDLFPFNYVHIGGDECNKSQWKVDPHAQRRMREEGLKDEEELQSYFIKRIEKIINARGRNMIGWDEILEGGLAPNATVMSWRGESGGITSAKAGHDVIMTPNKYCYIDLKQGHDDLEPNLGYSELLLSTSYNYKVIPEDLSQEEAKHILGIQANMWTESISDWGKLTYMTYPRLYAIAENGWTAESNQDWDDFIRRLKPQLQRLDKQGTRYAISAFNVWIDHKANEGKIAISMKTEVNGLEIRYTLDGSDPTIESSQYTGEFLLENSAVVKATTFKDGKQVGNISELNFPVHLAADAQVVYQTPYMKNKDGGGERALVDYNYGRLNNGDAAWQGFTGDMEVDIQFPQNREVNKVSMTALRFTISGIYLPEKVEVLGSEDGVNFTTLGETIQLEESHTQGRNKLTTSVDFEKTAVKVLKIKAKSVTKIPVGHHRVGEQSKIYVDEIVVE